MSVEYLFFPLGNDSPLQYSCLESFMDRGTWWAAVPGVSKNWMSLGMHTDAQFHSIQSQFLGLKSLTKLRGLSDCTRDSILSVASESPYEVSSQAVERAGNVDLVGLSGAWHTFEKCLFIGKHWLEPREIILLGTDHWVVFGDDFRCLWILSQWLPTSSLELVLLS